MQLKVQGISFSRPSKFDYDKGVKFGCMIDELNRPNMEQMLKCKRKGMLQHACNHPKQLIHE
jgi:hypothetical protein